MSGLGFGAHSGTQRSGGPRIDSMEQNAVRSETRRLLFEPLHDLVDLALRRDCKRPAARCGKVCDLLVLAVRRLQVNLDAIHRYGRPRVADEHRVCRRTSAERAARERGARERGRCAKDCKRASFIAHAAAIYCDASPRPPLERCFAMRHWISPTKPRRKIITHTTKMAPMITDTQAPT